MKISLQILDEKYNFLCETVSVCVGRWLLSYGWLSCGTRCQECLVCSTGTP